MQRLGRLARVARAPVRDRRKGGGTPALTRRTFVRLDGVSQHAVNGAAIAQTLHPVGGGPCAAYTLCMWLRGLDPGPSGPHRAYAAVVCAGEANPSMTMTYTYAGADRRVNIHRRRTTPTSTFVSRIYPLANWPDGTVTVADEWRLYAAVIDPASINLWDRGEFRTSPTPTATGDYNNAIGAQFSLGGSVTAAGAFVSGTSMPLDFRSPSVHLSALDAPQLAAIHAAGPAGDQSAAAGWWPGDGDTYPTLTNRGAAGSAWDLTLKNGSQAMIMEE